jgi:hypothetical protein
MATLEFFAIGSDNVIQLADLEDENGDLISVATVQGVLKRGQATVENGDVAFVFDGQPGSFTGTLSRDAEMIESRNYRLEITVDTGSNQFMIAVSRPAQYNNS